MMPLMMRVVGVLVKFVLGFVDQNFLKLPKLHFYKDSVAHFTAFNSVW